MAKEKAPSFPLLEALERATPEDLAEIDRRLEVLDHEAAHLRTVRKLLASKFEPVKERNHRSPRSELS